MMGSLRWKQTLDSTAYVIEHFSIIMNKKITIFHTGIEFCMEWSVLRELLARPSWAAILIHWIWKTGSESIPQSIVSPFTSFFFCCRVVFVRYCWLSFTSQGRKNLQRHFDKKGEFYLPSSSYRLECCSWDLSNLVIDKHWILSEILFCELYLEDATKKGFENCRRLLK